MFHHVRRRALLGCAASVLMLSGCTEGSGVPRQQGATPAAASPSASAAPPASWRDPAEQLADARVWVSTGRQSGGLESALPAKPAGGTVYVATQCQGTGTLTVDAGRYGTSTEHCSDRPDGSLNGAAMSSAEAATRLKVTAEPGVTWAVAVGWDERTQGPQE
ncbi:hypothetical protein PV350_23765 [Streptomyces sp. PA03-6a]|nr:hypothetical protein [Streptomyces sp. PA03-6a]